MITNAINANINFVYFCLNFKNDFIEQCWADEPSIINHIKGKFLEIYKRKGTGLMPFFFSELDELNQYKLSKWINENYLSFERLDDNAEKWYSELLGYAMIEKYPKEFRDWLDQHDTWAYDYYLKNRITKLIDLFNLWVHENF